MVLCRDLCAIRYPVHLNQLCRGNGLYTFDTNTYTIVQLHVRYATDLS